MRTNGQYCDSFKKTFKVFEFLKGGVLQISKLLILNIAFYFNYGKFKPRVKINAKTRLVFSLFLLRFCIALKKQNITELIQFKKNETFKDI